MDTYIYIYIYNNSTRNASPLNPWSGRAGWCGKSSITIIIIVIIIVTSFFIIISITIMTSIMWPTCGDFRGVNTADIGFLIRGVGARVLCYTMTILYYTRLWQIGGSTRAASYSKGPKDPARKERPLTSLDQGILTMRILAQENISSPGLGLRRFAGSSYDTIIYYTMI